MRKRHCPGGSRIANCTFTGWTPHESL
jgi:hypothetical protein